MCGMHPAGILSAVFCFIILLSIDIELDLVDAYIRNEYKQDHNFIHFRSILKNIINYYYFYLSSSFFANPKSVSLRCPLMSSNRFSGFRSL